MHREFFPVVKKTLRYRPVPRPETDVLGLQGTVWATDAAIYGENWYRDTNENLIEIYDAGAALVFRDLLPRRDKYAREGLYLRLAIAYRTTANANANIRTFSGNHVTLPNSVTGAIYDDPNTYYWVTEDMTINVNSIYRGEKIWIQRVEWEWLSKEVVYYDELDRKSPYLVRARADIEALYEAKDPTPETVRKFLIDRIERDEHFAKRCLAMLNADRLLGQDMVALYKSLDIREP